MSNSKHCYLMSINWIEGEIIRLSAYLGTLLDGKGGLRRGDLDQEVKYTRRNITQYEEHLRELEEKVAG
ncbi:MAG: hypothetical protein HY602_01505 [Parcubacteria group bacterium]|nr:hypothetical protein [Parcubacteria group bacterium]